MFNKVLQLLALTTILSIFGLVDMASNSADAQNPERPRPNKTERTLIIQPLIPPSEAVEYTILPSSGKITGRLGLPAAQLVNLPSELAQEIAVWTPPKTQPEPLKSEDIAYELISSTRYKGNGHTIVVATFRLSPAAAKLQQTFGNSNTLSDGTTAGVTVIEDADIPNRVVFMRNNLIVTVASDLPINDVKRLATTITLK